MGEQLTLPAEIRAYLPPEVQAYVAALERQMTLLRGQVTTLEVEMAKLQADLADAQARLQQHSGNSSRPPSSDPPSAPTRPKRPRAGRKRGGQKGHPRHLRLQLDEADLSAIVEIGQPSVRDALLPWRRICPRKESLGDCRSGRSRRSSRR
jgi:hypothetical protein